MRTRSIVLVEALPVLALVLALPMRAAGTSENPLTDGTKKIYAMLKSDVLKSAEEMPESDYSFKPTESVRNVRGTGGARSRWPV